MKQIVSCKDCMYFYYSPGSIYNRTTTECRKNPPPWHGVTENDWCGEFLSADDLAEKVLADGGSGKVEHKVLNRYLCHFYENEGAFLRGKITADYEVFAPNTVEAKINIIQKYPEARLMNISFNGSL